MNTLKQAFDRRGLTPAEAARKGGNYQTLWKQYRGERRVGPTAAMLYERLLGIPRSELRPDIWPPTEPPTTPPIAAPAQAGAANI